MMTSIAEKYAAGTVGVEELYKLRNAELKNAGIGHTATLVR